jgi:hypothetical protein
MLRIAIDYSINSPGICIENQQGISFGCVTRQGVAKDSTLESLREFDVHHYTSLEKNKNEKNLIDNSRIYTLDSIRLAEATIDTIYRMNGESYGDKKTNIISFEGFSFGSKANRLAQISGYQFILRYMLLQYFMCDECIENLYVFAPQTVKSIAGCAGRGQNKKDMITAFREEQLDHPFFNEILEHPETFQTKTGKYVKPIDDIVDSYFILKTLQSKV